jgi:hypothetical protein
MPKRRIRTASQIAASRRNLEKARKAKARNTIPRDNYSGKITAYHRTSHEAANSILKNGFKTNRANRQKRSFLLNFIVVLREFTAQR